MQNKNNTDILNIVANDFIKATNEILGVYEKFPSQFTLTDNFSIVLARIYQQFMCDLFPSTQLLVDNKRFISCAILSRSVKVLILEKMISHF